MNARRPLGLSSLSTSFLLLLSACGSNAELEDGNSPRDRDRDEDASVNSDDAGAEPMFPNFGDAGSDPNSCDPTRGSCDDAGAAEPACSDGIVNGAELCDDGNTESGDGCTANCLQVEANYVCPTPGKTCVSTVACGNSVVTAGAEECDDGNDETGDGCDSECQTEAGYACPFAGLACIAERCGDGILAVGEECESNDGEAPAGGSGCSPTCLIEPDYDCDPLTFACALTDCGNEQIERGEQCDDGNDLPFDGCYDCRLEPSCEDGVCTPVCGDGQRYDNEVCDDGNTNSGDGCSSDCDLELGFSCTDIADMPPESLTLPVIFRDFVGVDRGLDGQPAHTDFNRLGGTGIVGIAAAELGDNGKPAWACPGDDCDANPGHLYTHAGNDRPNMSTPENFAQWYTDVADVNITLPGEVELARQLDDSYLYDSADTSIDGISHFDPVGEAGWVALGKESLTCGPARNVSFTSETRFWFEYQGGERFDFSGDDDTWVFVNGKLAIDLGGLHGRLNGYFILDAADDALEGGVDTADGTATVDTDLEEPHERDFGLVPGGVYEVAMFQAERNECGSNFTVTLRDFNKPRSECASECGDGIVASDELCDDGENDGSYGGCMPGCKARGPYCGDANKDDEEDCDDGINLSDYGSCAPGCVAGPYCGDGIVQSRFEACDDGELEGDYSGCAEKCELGPRCGDGKVQRNAGETCDDKNRKSGDGCNANCREETVR